MNETAFNTSALNRSALDASALCGGGARRQRGFLPPGTPKAIREALVCWHDPARQGCTNENMAANPVLKDLSGNGHDLALHNFAWAGMSGIGGYRMQPGALGGLRCEACEIGDYKYKCANVMDAGIILYSPSYALGLNDGDPVTVRVTGLPEGATLSFNTTGYITATKDGVYSGRYDKGTYGDSVRVDKKALGATITVEFLPEYPGALVSDGVDDYCRAEGLPLLTDYTVIAKRDIFDTSYRGNGNILATKATLGDSNGAFQFERISANDGTNGTFTIVSFRGFNRPAQQPNGVSWMTSESYNGTPINKGTAIDSTELSLLSRGAVNPMKCALYSFLLFDRTLSEEEIEWVKENMVNGYPSPVAYYDCSKYSNGDMGDNPVLEDLSGNGNDLELHNFAFGGMSGFGGYNWNFNNFLRATYPHTDSTVRFDLSNPPDSYANEFTGYIDPSSVPAVLKGVKIKVSGISSSSLNLYYQINLSPSGNVRKDIVVDKDGIYEFPDVDLSQYEKINNVYYGISHLDTPASDIIGVELIPEYPGGLVFDGVDDYGIGSRESFDKCTMFMLFEPLTEKDSISFDARDSGTSHAFDIYRNGRNIAYNTYNANGTYINNILNTDKTSKALAEKKHLVAVKGDIDSGRNYFTLGVHIGKANYFDNMVLYKFLLFNKVLTQKQMDKAIRDYGLMDGVDDVWNEQQ